MMSIGRGVRNSGSANFSPLRWGQVCGWVCNDGKIVVTVFVCALVLWQLLKSGLSWDWLRRCHVLECTFFLECQRWRLMIVAFSGWVLEDLLGDELEVWQSVSVLGRYQWWAVLIECSIEWSKSWRLHLDFIEWTRSTEQVVQELEWADWHFGCLHEAQCDDVQSTLCTSEWTCTGAHCGAPDSCSTAVCQLRLFGYLPPLGLEI